MPEHPGFMLKKIHDRSIVQLRVRPQGVGTAEKALQLPRSALHWQGGDPASHWLGPDQWLFTSDTKPAKDIIRHIARKLADQLHAVTDRSSQHVCFALEGPAARKVLAMGCGVDLHPSAFMPGQCTRTHYANLLLFIVAVQEQHFHLYLDRSYARYLTDWFSKAGEDPITLL